MERAVHRFICLWRETGNDVTGHVKGKVPDTSFCLIGAVYRNHTFKYYTTTCLRHYVCVSVMPKPGRFFFSFKTVLI